MLHKYDTVAAILNRVVFRAANISQTSKHKFNWSLLVKKKNANAAMNGNQANKYMSIWASFSI